MKLKFLTAAIAIASIAWFGFTNNYETPVAEVNLDVEPTMVVGTNIGDMAPDIAMKSPDGKEMKLSDLRGKVVLVDFWASWCRPCRMENPNVVEAYKKYSKAKFKDKIKGFEVFSVSLDKDVARWEAAIKADNLDWKYHVSDLKGWQNEAAATYGVRSIPSSFLVDAEGKIIAKNLRGIKLHQTVDKLVKKF